jgi:hypothetical protein
MTKIKFDERKDTKDFRGAYSFRIRACECGAVHIDLYDKERQRFATVTFAPEQAEAICEDIRIEASLIEQERSPVH